MVSSYLLETGSVYGSREMMYCRGKLTVIMLIARIIPKAISRKPPLNMSMTPSFFFQGSCVLQIICKQGW